LTSRLRSAFLVAFVLALLGAGAASAARMQPLLASSTFRPLAGASTPCLNGGIPCYLPGELQAAYNFPSGPSAPTGDGQTIVVVTAYGAPFVKEDIQTFGMLTGVPAPPNLTVIKQQFAVPQAQGSGQTYFWQVETNLDVQWAYAMAPKARIVLAVANSDDTLDIAQVMREVVPRYPGAIVTQSFGMDETGLASDPTLVSTFEPMYLLALLRGGTIVAGSGDLGASNGTELERAFGIPDLIPSPMAAYPASDPLVLAVGGTMGDPYPDGLLTDAGTYGGEQVWNERSPFAPQAGASGGAPSVVFDAPSWQRSLQRGTKDRLVPDVAYNAALVDGALVILSCRQANDGSGAISFCDPTRQGYVAVGGTSAGAPQWAAIVALANQVRASQHRPSLGLVSPLLYELARSPRSYARDFHDITVGNNRLDLTAFGAPAPSKFSFDASPGYDLATGLGTPNVANLVADLAQRGSGDLPGNLARLLFIKGRLLHHRFDLSK
jgi:subtilase family serine protease